MLGDDLYSELESWDCRARGYQVWNYPVELAPYYEPLLAALRQEQTSLDDGKKPSIWSSLFGCDAPQPDQKSSTRSSGSSQPRTFRARKDLIEMQLVLPEGFVIRSSFAAEFLTALHNLSHPVSFELIGLPEGIVVQVTCAPHDRSVILENLRAYFPEVVVRENRAFLATQWRAQSGYASFVDFGLSEFTFRQLKAGPNLETDPLIGVIGALNELEPGEVVLVQVLFAPSIDPWGSDLWDLASSVEGLGELLPLMRSKLSQPMLSVVVRVAAVAQTAPDSFARARSVGSALIAATQSDMNMLIPLENDGYPHQAHAEDVIARETHRSGMLLNLSELLTLVHLPSASVRSERLDRQRRKTKAAPESTTDRALLLGINEHDGDQKLVGLSTAQRLRHTYVIGASGSGKSTLLLNMVEHDIRNGAGVAVLDPHGDLIEDILARIPPERVDDVVLIDPSDHDYPVGLNVLQARTEAERIVLSSDLVGVFRRLSTSWGDQMTSVFGNAILAFLESTEGGTLLDLRRFLVDASFRKRFLGTVTDSEVVYFWTNEFPLLRGIPQAPLLTRLDTFLRPKMIRYMVAQKRDRLNLRHIMDNRKILLAKLSQGAIGEENAFLLGSLLVARISQSAMMRQDQEEGARVPFYLYIDEFQDFVTPSIASIVSGARKYGLGLILAHQDLRQLKSRSEEVASAVLSNAYTRVVFRTSDYDAKALAEGFSTFDASDIQNLGIGEAIARVERSGFDFNLKVNKPEAVEPSQALETRERIRQASRLKFATPRSEVETALSYSRPPRSDSPGTPSKPPAQPQVVTVPEGIVADLAAHAHAPEPGRGGPQHKYLQSLVARMAQDRGFRASIEQPVLDGHGHVDVVLEREDLRVACEISITTGTKHEFGNLLKCLASGFDYVVLLSPDKRTLAAAESSFLPELSTEQRERVRLLQPERLMAFLDELHAQASASESSVRGYRVNVTYRSADAREKESRQRLVADVISKSLRRSKV